MRCLLPVLLLTMSCASMVANTQEKIHVESTPPGADARLLCAKGAVYHGVTPTDLTINRGDGACTLKDVMRCLSSLRSMLLVAAFSCVTGKPDVAAVCAGPNIGAPLTAATFATMGNVGECASTVSKQAPLRVSRRSLRRWPAGTSLRGSRHAAARETPRRRFR